MINEFDLKADSWDNNPMHFDRSKKIAENISKIIPLNTGMTALEFGAGTGITSFLLKDTVKEIIMMDNSDGMVRAMEDKIRSTGVTNLKALNFDLEKNNWTGNRFDLIFSQMVLHHVSDTESIIVKLSKMIKQGGYIALADLYTENGSFHGKAFTGHKGFDPSDIGRILTRNGFENPEHRTVYSIKKTTEDNTIKDFDVFLLTARLKK
ncbi:MAG TPA: class I SAM-dependent methyltransferase [Bacteroidales bacterium]|jgi:ubiquinone/menaquinone biosynthesis C-methylase UbiE|nr:class I SAM-dependent methyltransferase [Bacteroidales bacterium]